MTPLHHGRKAIACILLPHFPWQAETRRCPEALEGRHTEPRLERRESRSHRNEGRATDLASLRPPTPESTNSPAGQTSPVRHSENPTASAVILDGATPPTVLDCSPDLRGVIPGMPLSEALSRNKGARLIEPDMPHYRLTFERILKAIETRVPDVEDAGLGTAYAGIWGLEKLYGDDARVVHVLASAAPRFDIRIGLGENKWLAYVAASTSRHGSARKVTGEPGRFMSRFPIELLPVHYSTLQRLHSFGLHHMENIAALPRSAIQAQFGKTGALAWDLANGFDDRPLLPRRTQEVVSEHLTFPDATVSMATILPAIESLLTRAYRRPRLAKRYARETLLQAQVLRRPPWTLRVAFKEPAGSPTKALFAIKAKLDGAALPGPLEDMRLTLAGITGEAGRQESLWTEVLREQQLHDALSQLQARLGTPPPIYRVREMEPWSRIPERRHALVQLGP